MDFMPLSLKRLSFQIIFQNLTTKTAWKITSMIMQKYAKFSADVWTKPKKPKKNKGRTRCYGILSFRLVTAGTSTVCESMSLVKLKLMGHYFFIM